MNLVHFISVALALAPSVAGQHGPISGPDRNSDPNWEYWLREELGGYRAAQILRLDGDLMAVTHGSLFRLDSQTRKWVALGEPRSYDAAMAFEHGLLTSSRELGLARLNRQGVVLETVPSPLPSQSDFRRIVRDGAGNIWVNNKRGLLRLEGTPGALRLRIEALPGYARCDSCLAPPPSMSGRPGQPAPVADTEIDQAGAPWVAYGLGIVRFDKGSWRWQRIEPQLTDLRSIALAGDVIWVSGRTMAYYFQLKRAAPDFWTANRFMPADGYGPPDTFFIKRDSRGWIWRGASDGVHLSDGTRIAAEDWLHLETSNGLACGEADNYGFFEDEDRSVWIAGDQGITHLKPNPAWFNAPSETPRIRVLQQSAGVLRIKLEDARRSPFRKYPFRYRLDGARWLASRDGALQFDGLEDGSYKVEVAYTGIGAVVSSVSIRLGASPFGLLSLAVFVSLGALALFSLLLLRLDRFEPARYQFAKSWFVLRRRISGANFRTEPEEPPIPDLTGRTLLQRYQVQQVVAHGGYSTVYAALDCSTGAKTAVKQLRAPSQELRDRFTREVAALRSIQHPGIVSVLDSWIDEDGGACLAMPFLDGPTLRVSLSRGPLDLPSAVALVRDVGSALAELHARGIVHRDIKPENIILTGVEECAPILIDFGIAGVRDRQDRLSVTRTITGSFLYMAPECVTGHYSTATDVYSFAVLVLELLTLKRLLDLEADFYGPGFVSELEDILRCAVSGERARTLAGVLAEAYDPAPAKRPPVGIWAGRVADVLSTAF